VNNIWLKEDPMGRDSRKSVLTMALPLHFNARNAIEIGSVGAAALLERRRPATPTA
jgi:hypothetical protein